MSEYFTTFRPESDVYEQLALATQSINNKNDFASGVAATILWLMAIRKEKPMPHDTTVYRGTQEDR